MKNSEAFLNAFAKIERHLRRVTAAKPWMPFVQLVSRASKFSPEVRRFREDLREFADLRNAIVHDRMHDEVIAEPNAWAVERIDMIANLLTAPPAVIPLFEKRVFVIDEDQSLGEAVRLMRKHSFSKLPVQGPDGVYVGLLTANTIARWLGAVSGESVNLRKTTVREVVGHTENGESEVFVPAATSVFEVYEQFHRAESRGKTLEAVMITHDGLPSSKIIGIITISDLPRLVPYIELAQQKREPVAT